MFDFDVVTGPASPPRPPSVNPLAAPSRQAAASESGDAVAAARSPLGEADLREAPALPVRGAAPADR